MTRRSPRTSRARPTATGAVTWAVAAMLAGLTACGSAPPRAPAPAPAPARTDAAPIRPAPALPPPPIDRDGPEANPPPDLLLVPNAEPRMEPVRTGGPNKPYEVLGQSYVPLTGDPPLVERGLASWYGRKFHGRGTANGEMYNMYAMTAAHRTMPLPSYAKVRNPANGREVIVRVNDRGPFHSGRVIDLSYTAALKLGLLGGVAPVEVERITYDAIRAGTWRAPSDGRAVATLPEPAGPQGDDPLGDLARRRAARATGPVGSPAEGPLAAAPGPSAAVTPLVTPLAAPAAALHPAAAVPVPAAKAARGYWVQLGAFKAHEGAAQFAQRVAQQADWLAPLLAIFSERSVHRLQAGPYASRDDAQGAAQRLREQLLLVPAVVERR